MVSHSEEMELEIASNTAVFGSETTSRQGPLTCPITLKQRERIEILGPEVSHGHLRFINNWLEIATILVESQLLHKLRGQITPKGPKVLSMADQAEFSYSIVKLHYGDFSKAEAFMGEDEKVTMTQLEKAMAIIRGIHKEALTTVWLNKEVEKSRVALNDMQQQLYILYEMHHVKLPELYRIQVLVREAKEVFAKQEQTPLTNRHNSSGPIKLAMDEIQRLQQEPIKTSEASVLSKEPERPAQDNKTLTGKKEEQLEKVASSQVSKSVLEAPEVEVQVKVLERPAQDKQEDPKGLAPDLSIAPRADSHSRGTKSSEAAKQAIIAASTSSEELCGPATSKDKVKMEHLSKEVQLGHMLFEDNCREIWELRKVYLRIYDQRQLGLPSKEEMFAIGEQMEAGYSMAKHSYNSYYQGEYAIGREKRISFGRIIEAVKIMRSIQKATVNAIAKKMRLTSSHPLEKSNCFKAPKDVAGPSQKVSETILKPAEVAVPVVLQGPAQDNKSFTEEKENQLEKVASSQKILETGLRAAEVMVPVKELKSPTQDNDKALSAMTSTATKGIPRVDDSNNWICKESGQKLQSSSRTRNALPYSISSSKVIISCQMKSKTILTMSLGNLQDILSPKSKGFPRPPLTLQNLREEPKRFLSSPGVARVTNCGGSRKLWDPGGFSSTIPKLINRMQLAT